jgi:hypothetical protein
MARPDGSAAAPLKKWFVRVRNVTRRLDFDEGRSGSDSARSTCSSASSSWW